VVPGFIFRRKRRQFLKDLLQRERIYLSEFFHARLDAAARANLRRATR
jgi:predicted metal-dependent HD superfamily phosphohydrolase